MKKITFTLLVLFSSLKIFCLPVGNPSESILISDGILWDGHNLVTLFDYWFNPFISWFDVLSLRGGYYGDFVFNRHLQLKREKKHSIEKTKIITNAGYLALSLFENFDIFGTLGESKITIDSNARTFGGLSGNRFEIDTRSDFSWSVGARTVPFQYGCTAFGMEAQYFHTRPEVTRVKQRATLSLDPHHIHAKYDEWQFGFGLSHRINNLVPYIAFKWSRAKLNFDRHRQTFIFSDGETFKLHHLHSQNCIGGAIGVSLVDCKKGAMTVEGRFGDETGLYVNGQIRF